MYVGCMPEYTLVAKALYEKVIGSKVDQKDLKNRALDFLKEAPVIDMTRPLVISFFDWIDKRLPWEEVMPQLTTMRDHGWLATKSSPILRRTVSSLEHPMLFNPLQSLISILHKCISGEFETRPFVFVTLVRMRYLYSEKSLHLFATRRV